MKVDPIRGAERGSRREGATTDVLLQSVIPTPLLGKQKNKGEAANSPEHHYP